MKCNGSTINGSRVVRSEPGQGTASTILITEDGRRWVERPMYVTADQNATGVYTGTLKSDASQ